MAGCPVNVAQSVVHPCMGTLIWKFTRLKGRTSTHSCLLLNSLPFMQLDDNREKHIHSARRCVLETEGLLCRLHKISVGNDSCGSVPSPSPQGRLRNGSGCGPAHQSITGVPRQSLGFVQAMASPHTSRFQSLQFIATLFLFVGD